jgi:hypothetical protein
MGNKMTEETEKVNVEMLLIKALFRLLKPSEGVVVDDDNGNKFVVYTKQIDNNLTMQLKVAEGKETELELGTLVYYYDTPEAAMAAAEAAGEECFINHDEAIH